MYVLCCIFLSFVEGFGVDLGANLVSKRGAGGQKEVQNEVQVVPGGDSGDDFGTNKNQRHNTIITGTDLGSISGSFWTPKSINWGIDFVLISVMCFLSPLERFVVDFGAILESKSDKNAKYRYMRNRCFMYVKAMFLRFDGVNPGPKCMQNRSRDSKTFRA